MRNQMTSFPLVNFRVFITEVKYISSFLLSVHIIYDLPFMWVVQDTIIGW